jgi:hypothetical protein
MVNIAFALATLGLLIEFLAVGGFYWRSAIGQCPKASMPGRLSRRRAPSRWTHNQIFGNIRQLIR